MAPSQWIPRINRHHFAERYARESGGRPVVCVIGSPEIEHPRRNSRSFKGARIAARKFERPGFHVQPVPVFEFIGEEVHLPLRAATFEYADHQDDLADTGFSGGLVLLHADIPRTGREITGLRTKRWQALPRYRAIR